MSLSEKRITKFFGKKQQSYYPEEDVKEFIKGLKKELEILMGPRPIGKNEEIKTFSEHKNEIIDKLAGEKLIWNLQN